MLYDGAIQFMEAGKAAMKKKDLYNQSHNLQRAQKIVAHLMGTLDMERGGDISANLWPLYNYVYGKLVSANIRDQSESIDECLKIFTQLREGWSELDEKIKRERNAEPVAA